MLNRAIALFLIIAAYGISCALGLSIKLAIEVTGNFLTPLISVT